MSKKDWPSIEYLTVSDLKRQLNAYHDDWIVDFSGLEFYRLKARGENLVQIEFSELVYRDLKTGLVSAESADGPRSPRAIIPDADLA